MRFSSMAVSILAQSVPLLAVGHLAGWKTREERSRLKRRRLRDALLVGVNDKIGMSFEKRVGVHGKQDNELDKNRSGSARLAQDNASKEVLSDDRESSIECDPLSEVSDSGIFGCGMDSHCVESENSELGGLCVTSKQASSISRTLQVEEGPTCSAGPNAAGTTCDCSQFDNTSGVGTFTCTTEYCAGTTCFVANSVRTFNADGLYSNEYCYEFDESVMGVESYCYSYGSGACTLTVNGIECICGLEQATCPDTSEEPLGNTFDCTNTDLSYTDLYTQGDTCATSILDTLLLAGAETAAPFETGAPSTSETGAPETGAPSISETGAPSTGETGAPDTVFDTNMPTTPPVTTPPLPTQAPNASPSTLEPAASSGSSHAAKVAIVVVAASAAWMASFGA